MILIHHFTYFCTITHIKNWQFSLLNNRSFSIIAYRANIQLLCKAKLCDDTDDKNHNLYISIQRAMQISKVTKSGVIEKRRVGDTVYLQCVYIYIYTYISYF